MTGAEELGRRDALAQAELVRGREVSPEELLEAALERIDAVNPQLNAVVARRDEAARSSARGAHAAAGGPLSGVPFLLKDLRADDAGWRCTEGSRAYAERVPTADTVLVSAIKAAGLVVCGRTATPEFGNASTTGPPLFGVTRNPWELGRTPGGSSGGAAAAVAAGVVPAAHASDGGGSIRTPAACCGLYGLKPSRGRVSSAPGADLIAGWSVQHAVTRSVRDSAALLDAIAGAAPGDLWAAPPPARSFLAEVGADPGRLRVAVDLRPPSGARLDADCERVAREAAAQLESLGHHVDVASPAIDWPRFAAVYLGLVGAAFAAALEGLNHDLLDPLSVAYAERGLGLSATDYLARLADMQAINRELARFLARFDVWLSPALTEPALELGELSFAAGDDFKRYMEREWAWNPWHPLANCAGLPSASLPLGETAGGLPVGVQVTAGYAREATLLRLSTQLEAARPWATRWPPLNAVGAHAAPTMRSASSP